jgi:hypothetical protein
MDNIKTVTAEAAKQQCIEMISLLSKAIERSQPCGYVKGGILAASIKRCSLDLSRLLVDLRSGEYPRFKAWG